MRCASQTFTGLGFVSGVGRYRLQVAKAQLCDPLEVLTTLGCYEAGFATSTTIAEMKRHLHAAHSIPKRKLLPKAGTNDLLMKYKLRAADGLVQTWLQGKHSLPYDSVRRHRFVYRGSEGGGRESCQAEGSTQSYWRSDSWLRRTLYAEVRAETVRNAGGDSTVWNGETGDHSHESVASLSTKETIGFLDDLLAPFNNDSDSDMIVNDESDDAYVAAVDSRSCGDEHGQNKSFNYMCDPADPHRLRFNLLS